MSTGTGIEWTEATWNPVAGCTRVNADCDHCYAVGMTRRLEGMSEAPGRGRAGDRARKYVGLTVKMKPAALACGVSVNGWHFNGKVVCDESALEAPLRWKTPKMIFVNSMGDLFHNGVPDEFIARVWAVMEKCGPSSWSREGWTDGLHHTFQVLTKRPARMAKLTNSPEFWAMVDRFSGCDRSAVRPLPHIWLGTSCGHQAAADEMIPHLIRCPAVVRFLSCEPLWGPVDLFLRSIALRNQIDRIGYITPNPADHFQDIRWVIAGGESGPGARPCDVAWLRSLRDQCKAAGVPFFLKQLGSNAMELRICPNDGQPSKWRLRTKDGKGGEWSEWPEDLCVREMPQECGGVVWPAKRKKGRGFGGWRTRS